MEQTSEELPIWRPAEPDPAYEPPSPVKEDRGLFKRIGAGIAALGALIAKFAAQLKVLLLLLPKAKLFATAGSMLVSIGAYALLWGWQFGVGFVLLLLVPLDGGRAMAAISPLVWLVGFAGLLAGAVLFPNPIILLIVLFAGLEGWRRFKARNSPEAQEYHRVSRGTRIGVAAVYIGLA